MFIAFILRNISVLFYDRSKTAFHKASIAPVPVFIQCSYGNRISFNGVKEVECTSFLDVSILKLEKILKVEHHI